MLKNIWILHLPRIAITLMESVRYYGVICQCWLSNQNGALRRPDSVSTSRFGERRALLLARYVMRAYAVDVCSRYINGCGRGKSWGYRRCWYSMKRHGQSGYYVSSLSIHAFRARRASASLVRVYTRSKVHIRGVMRAGTKRHSTSPSISAYALSDFNERELRLLVLCPPKAKPRSIRVAPSLALLALPVDPCFSD